MSLVPSLVLFVILSHFIDLSSFTTSEELESFLGYQILFFFIKILNFQILEVFTWLRKVIFQITFDRFVLPLAIYCNIHP